jgi:hypothetical protein
MTSLSPLPVMVLTPVFGAAATGHNEPGKTSDFPRAARMSHLSRNHHAQVVVDLANSPSFEDKAVLEFFETSERRTAK